jgi:hypothetical protein
MKIGKLLPAIVFVITGLATGAQKHSNAKERPNPDLAAVLQDFNNRVTEYMKMRGRALSETHKLKQTDSAEAISHHEYALARRIREERQDTQARSIFTPEAGQEFRRRLTASMEGPVSGQIRQSLRDAEPLHARVLRANTPYPEGLPLQSTPPSLLLSLPPLPKELEYRVVGHSLVIRDIEANLVVDVLNGAIP